MSKEFGPNMSLLFSLNLPFLWKSIVCPFFLSIFSDPLGIFLDRPPPPPRQPLFKQICHFCHIFTEKKPTFILTYLYVNHFYWKLWCIIHLIVCKITMTELVICYIILNSAFQRYFWQWKCYEFDFQMSNGSIVIKSIIGMSWIKGPRFGKSWQIVIFPGEIEWSHVVAEA